MEGTLAERDGSIATITAELAALKEACGGGEAEIAALKAEHAAASEQITALKEAEEQSKKETQESNE